MTVADLQALLRSLDPDLEVVCWDDSASSAYDLVEVRACMVERARAEDGRPILRFRSGPDSATAAIMEITADL